MSNYLWIYHGFLECLPYVRLSSLFFIIALSVLTALPANPACQVEQLVEKKGTYLVMKKHKTALKYGSVAKPVPPGKLASAAAGGGGAAAAAGGGSHETTSSIGITTSSSGISINRIGIIISSIGSMVNSIGSMVNSSGDVLYIAVCVCVCLCGWLCCSSRQVCLCCCWWCCCCCWRR